MATRIPSAGDALAGRLLGLCWLAAAFIAAGCASPPAMVPRSADPSVVPSIADEEGLLTPVEAKATVGRLARESDLLAHHLRDVEGILATPLVLGNEARLLVDGPTTYAAMFDAIGKARHHVHLQTYILEAGDPGDRLAELLGEKHAQGVSVKLLFDGVGSRNTPPEYFDRLRANGVDTCEFNPINPLKADKDWELNNRGHRKLLVVDGRIAFTGGVNISGVYSSGSFSGQRGEPREEGWRDTHVEVRGPVVADFQRLFLEAWARQDCTAAVVGEEYFPPLARRGDQAMRLVAADPKAGRSEFYLALLSALEHARWRAWLTYGYFVPDRRVLNALTMAALRGVDVRLVLPGVSDFWATLYAGRSHYNELLKAGVRIFERRDALLHAKTAVVDGVWSAVGSTNLDWRSFVHNYEADLLVLDDSFGTQLEALFHRDEAASHEVVLPEWRRRGLGERVLEWFARVWEYLL